MGVSVDMFNKISPHTIPLIESFHIDMNDNKGYC